jgi:DNA helicase HerA-like ATPase
MGQTMDGSQRSTTDVVVGRIVAIAGAQITVQLEASAGGDNATALQIGTLIKTQTPDSVIFGVVRSLTITAPGAAGADAEIQMAEISMIGETRVSEEGKLCAFQRGMSRSPSLDRPIFTTTSADLARVYAAPNVPSVNVGVIHQDTTLPAHVLTDELLGKHFGILGTTGSGKSCAVVLLLREILDKHPNAHVVMLDPHNEYATAFGDRAEVLHTDTLELPYWLLNFDELMEVLFGAQADEGSPEAAILADMIPQAKRDQIKDPGKGAHFTVDTPVPYKFTDLIRHIDQEMGKLDKNEATAPYRRLRSRLTAMQTDIRFGFMFGGISITDHMPEILGRLFRIPVDGKPISIIDLSGIPSEILNVVVSVICRLTFDFALWCERSVPILLVCEEAHRYAPAIPERRYEMTKQALSRIAKEGRKYGASLCVVSQRPSQLAPDLLSQCNTLFAMRMSNNDDQEHLRGAMSESTAGLLEFLPSLGNGEAVAVGQGVSLPVRIKFKNLPEDQRPHSSTAVFTESWNSGAEDLDYVREIVQRLRRL